MFEKKRIPSWSLVIGQSHLVLNKTLTDDTSVKWAQIKTFFVESNFVETWRSCSMHDACVLQLNQVSTKLD